MNFDNQLLFFFSALGAFNSSFLSIYFFFASKPKHFSNYYLGALLAVLSIRIWKSVFFYFNPDLSKFYLQIGLSACFLIGPFLYFFIKSRLSNSERELKNDYLQLVVLVLLILTVGYLYPYKTYPELWGNIFYKAINYQWLIYIITSAFILKDVFKKIFKKSATLTSNEVWSLSVFSGVFIIWMAYFFASYTSYIMGALSFSFVLYLSFLLFYYKREKAISSPEQKEKYVGHKISEKEANKLLSTIDTVLNKQGLFKNPDLTLPQLAEEIKVRPHLISQLLNDNLNKNFSLFINEYRIEEAKRILDSNRNLKIEAIAEMCGFNSISTFYSAFKKITNTTPAKYSNS
ncbi:helix-turn-helix transcriptional regulator [Sinomicrobium kalidii]|uniref:helix-turn-helix transcriptional regulator n=1 Tax=Sinomicrobium kalidii TaxID=2900738 RepID=UPI001E4B75CC|nr:response regulator transcription factor [Sinomicrobium kalidii]UGU15939.1 helix-turn-helix transcriptional regulator [Sinomicrobium kalidii]